MRKTHYVIVVLLGLAMAAGASYFTYPVFHPHRHTHEQKVIYVHPLVGEVEKARRLRVDGKLAEAQQHLRGNLRIYPNAPHVRAARDLLGKINTEMFFSADHSFAKTEYVVKRGDSLWRIARKLDSSPVTIMRANTLESDLIHPGDRLLVPDSDFTLTLDLPNQRAVVHHGDGFFKQYPIIDINLPHSNQKHVTTKVIATTFWKNGKMISPDVLQDDSESLLRIHLEHSGYVLYGVDEESGLSDSAIEITGEAIDTLRASAAPPHGIALFRDDLAQLHLLLRRGTPVTIVRVKPSPNHAVKGALADQTQSRQMGEERKRNH